MDNIKSYTNRIQLFFKDAKADGEVTECLIKKMVTYMYEYDRNMLDSIVTCFEGISKYNNYVSQNECSEILNNSVNENGSRGFAFNKSVALILDCLERHGKILNCEPHYNKYALIVTMHKFASDQGSVIKRLVNNDEEKFICVCYDLAVCQLKDVDKKCWVRWYFNL